MPNDKDSLTRREREIAELYVQGLNPRQIAMELHLTYRYIDVALLVLRERLKCQSRVQLIERLKQILGTPDSG